MSAIEKRTNITDKRSKLWRWTLSIFLILLAIFISGAIFISYKWKPFISKKIKEAVSQSTQGLYTVDFSDIHINLLAGSTKFDSLSFKADTAIFSRLRETGDAPKHLFNVDLDALFFTNIQFWNIYFKKELSLKTIVIDKPSVTITYNEFRARVDTAEKKTAYQQLSKFLKSLQIHSIVLKDADVQYIDHSDAKPRITKFKGITATVSDLHIDSASQFDKSRFYYTKDISLGLKNHRFITRDGLYAISFQDIMSSTSRKTVTFSNLRVKPLYPEMEFSKKYKTQHDRYNLYFKEISLNDIDFLSLNTQHRLIASNLLIDAADINIFMNRELPPVTFDKGRNYPHVVLKRLKLNTRIDTIRIQNTSINYSEYNPASEKKGTVTFNRLHATIINVTNDSLSLIRNHWTRAETSAWLMNKGSLNVQINFNLTSKKADFNFNGTMGKMDMRSLNQLARNLSLTNIRSGTINKAEFEVSGNRNTSVGYIKLYYNNLKVDLLKNDDDRNELEKRGVVSALANTLVIKNDNPGEDGTLRIGKTVTERLKSASFFNLMWKSLFVGIKESVGATSKEVDEVQVKPDKQEQRRLERKNRRETRRKEREQKRKY